MHGIGWADAQELAQAAFKAGERQGRKDMEELCMHAIELRERMSSNAKVSGGGAFPPSA